MRPAPGFKDTEQGARWTQRHETGGEERLSSVDQSETKKKCLPVLLVFGCGFGVGLCFGFFFRLHLACGTHTWTCWLRLAAFGSTWILCIPRLDVRLVRVLALIR
jgi:hypothetical protein